MDKDYKLDAYQDEDIKVLIDLGQNIVRKHESEIKALLEPMLQQKFGGLCAAKKQKEEAAK